jgi:hypothetical protein
MNAAEYKEICSKPDVLPKLVLERTLAALKKEGAPEATVIEAILSGTPIPFPEKYSGEKDQSHFKVSCSEKEAEAITDVLFDLEASSVPPNGIGTSETSQYVELVNIWSELTEYVGKNV